MTEPTAATVPVTAPTSRRIPYSKTPEYRREYYRKNKEKLQQRSKKVYSERYYCNVCEREVSAVRRADHEDTKFHASCLQRYKNKIMKAQQAKVEKLPPAELNVLCDQMKMMLKTFEEKMKLSPDYKPLDMSPP